MTAATHDSIRSSLAAGTLAQSGGVLVASLLGADSVAALAAEATYVRSRAETYRVRQHDAEENRGGEPDRWLESAVAGPRLRTLYSSHLLAELLGEVTGVDWTPSGGSGTYSYYCHNGHYLGLHRDVEECDLAVIISVADDHVGDPGHSGTLCVYPQRSFEPLSAIRASPDRGAFHIRVRPGEAAVLLGGIVPHRVVPVGKHHERVVAPLCFSATAG